MSDEKKDVNSQQENVGKKGINKKLIIAFAGMGAVIVGLVIALILVATSGKKDVDSSASKAESSSAVASETDDTSEEDSVADESEDESDADEEESSQESKDDKKEKGFIISYSGDNSWQDGDKVMTGMEIGIENNSDEALKEWTLELEIDQLKSCDGWNGNFKVKGNKLTVTNVDYNGEIAKGGSTSIGCNIGTGTKLNVKSAKLNGVECTVKKGKVSQNNNNNNNNNNTSTTKKPAATVPPAPSDPKGTTPVSQHGQLSVKNGQLVDKSGKGYQLRGMSTHGLTWFPEFVNESAFKTLRDDWNTNVVRLAMYVDEWGNGQCYMGNKSGSLELLEKGVDICIKLDMYVIIDWHVLNPGDPSKYTNEAKSFFETVSKRYAKYPNVIYEICNEPNGGASWSSNIKPYAEKIIPVIRKNAPNSVIIVGTPTWSQEIDKPLSDPLSYKNVMYAFHFYAATHAGLRSNVENCVAQGLPVFVSEFGTCDASGGGANDFNETQKWLSYFDKQGISYCNWSICNKDETCSVLRPGTSANGNWSESDLTENGKWIRNWLRKH